MQLYFSMANVIINKLGCFIFFFFFLFALFYLLSDRFVDGIRIGSIKKKGLIRGKGTIKTIEVIMSTKYFFLCLISVPYCCSFHTSHIIHKVKCTNSPHPLSQVSKWFLSFEMFYFGPYDIYIKKVPTKSTWGPLSYFKSIVFSFLIVIILI